MKKYNPENIDLNSIAEAHVPLLPEDTILSVLLSVLIWLPEQKARELAILEACRRSCAHEDDFMGEIGYHVQVSIIISSYLN